MTSTKAWHLIGNLMLTSQPIRSAFTSSFGTKLESKLVFTKQSLKTKIKDVGKEYRLNFEDCKKEWQAKSALQQGIRRIIQLLELRCKDKKLVEELRSFAKDERKRTSARRFSC